MNKQIATILKTRNYLLDLTKDLSPAQLNKIPPAFNNNIIWNLAHLIAGQQGICYIRAGLEPFVGQPFFATYKPGTKPEKELSEAEISEIKKLFISSLEQFAKDYENGIFEKYLPSKTRYGVELTNIEEAIDFLTFHEGLHVGYIMAMKHLL